MALRAGYYGVKKSMLSKIASLAAAKIIKTIGDGLKLTSAGKLSCDIDTDTMDFKNGKLAAKLPSSYTIDELWDYEVEGLGTVVYNTYNLTLRHTVADYDEILVELISVSADATGEWSSSVQWRFNVEALENARVENTITFCSFGERTSKFVIDGTTFQAVRSNPSNYDVNGIVKIYGIKY